MYSPAPSFPVPASYPASARRARLKEHFVQVAAEVLTDYTALSDGARLTYLVLLSFDYLDEEQGNHKGVVFPSVETLMAKRNKSRSTIYSHLTELEACGLIETLPGVGWRLYNPSKRPHDPAPTQEPLNHSTAATSHYSAPQPYPQTSLPSADVPLAEENVPTPEFRKSGQGIKDEEEEITLPKQKQYSKAGDSNTKQDAQRVVHDLQKFGFAPWLAIKFLQQYGTERVERQLRHLEAQRSRGVPIQNGARWLYRAIEQDYQFPDEHRQQQATAKHPHYSLGTPITLSSGEVIYELIEQEQGVPEEEQEVLAALVKS